MGIAVTRRRFAIFLLLLLAAIAAVAVYPRSPETQVRRMLEELVADVSFNGRTNPLMLPGITRGLEVHLAPKLAIDCERLREWDEIPEEITRKQLLEWYSGARMRLEELSLTWNQIGFRTVSGGAELELRARAVWRLPGSDERYFQGGYGVLLLERGSEGWRIKGVRECRDGGEQ